MDARSYRRFLAMKLTRLALLAVLSATVSTGCRTAGLGTLRPPSPPPLPAQPSLKAAEVLKEHNENARRIQSFETRSSITVASGLMKGAMEGRIVMERPRNFKLRVFPVAGGDVADIGSN